MTVTEAPPRKMLNIELPPGIIPSTTFMDWTLTPNLVSELKRRRFEKPYLLIMVRSVRDIKDTDDYGWTEYSDTDMHMVPLLNSKTRYISFSRPGHNQIVTMVVDLNERSASRALGRIHSNVRGSYSSFFDDAGQADWSLSEAAGGRYINCGMVDVEVNPNSFAAEPPEWNKMLVRQFFRSKDFDQCHFGKRSFLAGMLLLPTLLLSYIGKLLMTLLGLFLGLSKLNVKQLQMPFEFNPFNIFDTVERSIWVEKKEQDKNGRHPERHGVFFLLNPVVLLLPALVVFAVFQIPNHHGKSVGRSPWCGWGWWHTMAFVDGLIVAGVVLVGVGFLLAPLFMGVIGSDFLQKPLVWFARVIGGRENVRQERLHQELQALVLNPQGPADVQTTPKPRRRSFAVLFAQLKAEVCKPYAR